jgi:predicted Zn finger-like uncharacterized protein
MFTVCPKCALTLTVTAADLRIAQGFVRCGQCTNVFNALLALSDERQPVTGDHEQHVQQSPTPEEPAPEEPAHDESVRDESVQEESIHDDSVQEESLRQEPLNEDIVHEDLVHDEPSPEELAPDELPPEDENSIEQTSLEFNPAAADVSMIFVEPQMIADDAVTGTYESIVLRTQETAPVDEHEPPRGTDEDLNDQLESLAARIDAARQNQLAQTNTSLEHLLLPIEAEEPAATRELRPLVWAAALGGLAMLLVAQAINHYRDELAVNPRLHRPLSALYAMLGVTLVPRWDLAAYEVHQLGAQAAPQNPGQITVRASVRNDAQQPQPLPLLRVTLLDRFGNRLASRDVSPRAYLGGAPAATALLPPGERVDAQMAFVDPGKNAVGFEIDACLPAPSARVHCANDAVAR